MVKLAPLALVAALAGAVAGDAVQDLVAKGRASIEAQLAKSTTCTKATLQVRREWGDLSIAQRKEYIAAVKCLMTKPSKLNPTQFPGAKNRYDDFVVVHMNQTLTIHGTGNFLSWHRYYTHAWEQALKVECAFAGAQPFWDWGKWAADPEKSPIFDGSDTSMSGNGERITHGSDGIKPAGNGGGCVKTGPFAGMNITLGPVSPVANPAPARNPRADGYGFNPRCLRRDMSNYLTTRYTRTQDIVSLINNAANIATFQNNMQAGTGVHGSGHFTISGDPGGDFYTSPNDPGFWLHHGMIDRTWYTWQVQNLQSRLQVIAGGTSMMGFNSRQQSLEDYVDLGVVNPGGKAWKIKDLVSTVDGPFCYIYE